MSIVNAIGNWLHSHSKHIFALLTVLPTVWEQSSGLQAHVPIQYAAAIETLIALCGFIGHWHKEAITDQTT